MTFIEFVILMLLVTFACELREAGKRIYQDIKGVVREVRE